MRVWCSRKIMEVTKRLNREYQERMVGKSSEVVRVGYKRDEVRVVMVSWR